MTLLDNSGSVVAQVWVADDGTLWAADGAGGDAVNISAGSANLASAAAPGRRTFTIGGVTVTTDPGGNGQAPYTRISWNGGTSYVMFTQFGINYSYETNNASVGIIITPKPVK
jgi:ammonia channel protein AmtB